MDGTKPAMESNAEETQEEGQESKGIKHPQTFAHFFAPFVFSMGDICASLSGLTYLHLTHQRPFFLLRFVLLLIVVGLNQQREFIL